MQTQDACIGWKRNPDPSSSQEQEFDTSLRSQTPSDQRRPAKPGTLGLERRLYLEHFVNGSSEGA